MEGLTELSKHVKVIAVHLVADLAGNIGNIGRAKHEMLEQADTHNKFWTSGIADDG